MAGNRRREKSEYEKALEKFVTMNPGAVEEQRQRQAAVVKQNQLNEYESLQRAYGETLRKWGNKQGTTMEEGPGLGRSAVMNAYGDLQNRYNTLSGTGGAALPGQTKAQMDRNAAFMASGYGQALQKLLQRQTAPNAIEQTLIGKMQRENGREYADNRMAYNELKASYQRPPEGYASHEEAYRVMMGDDRDSSFAGIFGTDYKEKQRERERLRAYYGERGAFDTMESAWNGNAAWMTDEGIDKNAKAYERLVEESQEKDEKRYQTGVALDDAMRGIMSGQNSPREANELVYDIYQNGKSGQASVEALTDISRVYLGIETPDISDPETYRASYAIYEKILRDPEGVIRENNEAAEKQQEEAMERYKQAETAWNEPYTSKTEAYNQALENLQKEKERRSKRRAMEEEARADPEFESKSQWTGQESYQEDFWNMSFMDRLLGREDDSVLASYINSDKYREDYEITHENPQASSGGTEYKKKGYDLLEDKDKKYYNYFYKTQGAKRAMEYLDVIESDLLRRRSEIQEDRQTTLAENPIMGPVASADTILNNFADGITMTLPRMIGAMNGDTDTNSALYDNRRYINTIRQTRGQVWAESPLGNVKIPFINANAGELGYQTLMSLGDNAMALGVAGKIAGGTKAITALTQGIMSSEAASGALVENLNKGMDPGQAVALAGLSGVIEAATEKYSIEALLSDPKNLLSYVAKNAFTEGTEEVASTLLNTAADELAAKITGNKSDIRRQYNELLLQNPGMSQQEATRRVLTDYLQGMGADFLGGAISGAAMSGGRAVQTQVQRSAIGSDINMTKSGSQLLQVAEAMEDGSESRTLAEKLRARETQGKKLSNGAVGQLYQTLYTELDEKGRETVRQVMADSVEARLVALGESQETAKAIAPLMMRVASGEQISRGERSQIAGATYGTRVLNELRFADEDTHSSQWARESNEQAESAKGKLLAPMQAFERQRETARAMGQKTEAQEKRTVKEAEEKARTLTAEGMEKTRPNRVSMEAMDEDGQRGEVLRMVENRDGSLDVVVKHAEGTEETVPYDSRTYSGGVAHIISYANMSGERMTAQKANLMLHSYTGGDAGAYIQGYNRVYNAGYDGRAMPTNVGLPEKQAKVIYDQARRDGQEAESRRKAQTGQGERRGKGRVRLSAEVNEKTLTQGQRTSIAALSAIARQTGVHFEVFASEADAEGNYVTRSGISPISDSQSLDWPSVPATGEGTGRALSVNGWYDRKTNTIHIDVNSGKNNVGDVAEYAILRTASHELTHFIENNSKEGYAALKAFIVGELERKGLDFDALVQRKQDRSNVRLTREDAMAEVIADGCEMMLQDSQAIARMAQEDKSLFQKVKGFVMNFLQKIKAAFSGVEAQSIEARSLADMREGARHYAEELQRLWDDALVEAARETRQAKVEVTVEESGKVPQYSMREQDQIKEDKYFAREIDRWDGMAAGGRFKLGAIQKGSIYEGVGLPAGELYMDISKAANALQKHGDHLSKNLLKQIPQMLAKPVVITEPINPQVRNTVNVFGDMRGDNGKPIMIAIMMRPDRSGSYLVNVVRSIEMRSDADHLITEKSILYLDSNKKRTAQWFQGLGNSSVPFAGTKGGFIRRIAYREGRVNQATEKKFSLWDDALVEAAKTTRQASVEVTVEEGGKVPQYSMRDSNGQKIVLTEAEIEENKKKIALSETVAQIEGNRFAKNPQKDFMTMGAEYFEEIGGKAYNPVLGKVVLNDSGVRHLISQGVTRRRSAMMEAVKPCIEKGEIIHIENNHKGHFFDTALIAARVELDGQPYYMGVVVRQTKDRDNSYYMHDAVLVQKRRVVDSIQQDTDVSKNAGGTRVEPNNPSIASILASIEDYNPQQQENEQQFSLREYSEHQKENWKDSKLINIYENDEQLRAFVERALSDRSYKGKMYFGQVSEELAQAIYDATGVETEGLNLALYSDEVVKIIKDHGSEKTETLRGQVAISERDFAAMKDIVQNPDVIKLSAKAYEGHKAIEFVKDMQGRTTIVTYVVSSKHDLRVQTMYKGKEKKSLASVKDANASLNAPRRADTSMTSRGTAPTNSISQPSEENNPPAQFSLREYSEHQKENWKDSKLINIYENDEQLRAFVERALSDRSYKGKMYFGQVSEELAQAIYDATGVETEGLNLALYSDEVAKIIKDHGNDTSEALRGQRGIKIDDFRKIVDIVTSPDAIRRSEQDYFGKPVIVFTKYIDGKYESVTYVSTKHHDLRVQTLYAGNKKESLATPIDEQASINTPKASSGTALPHSISQTFEENNPSAQFSMREEKAIENAGIAEKHFGTTSNVELSGYLDVNGKYLDFSGRHWGNPYAEAREVDHRDILEAFEDSYDDGNEAMVDFMKQGNIRLSPESGGINLQAMPNEKQKAAIKRYINHFGGEVAIDIDDEKGQTIHSLVYDRGTSSTKIIEALNGYFEYNILDNHAQFSIREDAASMRAYMRMLEAEVMENERDRAALQRYQRALGEMSLAQERLNRATREGDERLMQQYGRQLDRFSEEVKRLEKSEGVRKIQESAMEFARSYVEGKSREEVAAMLASEALDSHTRRWLQSTSTQKLLDMREQYENRLATERAKRNLTADNAAKRRQIGRLVKSMDKKIRMERDDNHVLEAYKPVVEQMVKTFIDSESNAAFTRGEAIGVSRVYAMMMEMDNREDIDIDQEILDDLEEIKVLLGQDVGLAKAPGERTEIEKLQARNTILKNLAEVVQHFNKIVNDAGTAFVEGKRQRIDVLAEDAAEEMRQRKPRRELAGSAGRVMRTADNAIGTGNITPYYFFRRMGNSVMDRLWQDIRRGQNRYGLRLAEAREAVQEIKSRYNYDSWKDAEALTFTTVQGRTITLDAETAMQLYATWRRETQTPLVTSTHLENGGFVYGEENRPTEGKLIKRQTGPQSGNRLNQEDMKTIEDWLKADMKGYADAMVSYLSTTVGEWGNETSMEQLGIRKYKEAYYIPMEVAGDALRKGSNEGATDPENKDKNKARPAKVSRPGFSKTRVQNANKPLVMRGLTQTALRHINGMITYTSFALPIESMNSVLNAQTATKDATETTLRQVVGETYGRNSIAYIETLLRDLNGGAVTDPAERAWNKMVSLFKKGAVYGSASVAAQQPLSYIRAAAMMNPKYLAAAMARRGAGFFSGAYEEAKRYSGVAVIKEVGRIDMGLGMSAVEYLDGDPDVQMGRFAAMMEGAKRSLGIRGYERFKEQWNNALGYLPGKMDEITWGRLWTACKLETAEKNPMLDTKSDAFMEKVAERFNDVIDATQVYDSTLSRSQNMRSNTGMMNMITSFMAEPTQTLNMLIYAFTNQEGGKGQRIGRRAVAVTIYALSVVAGAAVKGAFTAGRKDDEEKTFLEKWAAGFASNAVSEVNPLGLIPGVRDMVSLLEGSDVDRADLSVLNEFITAGSRLTSDKYTTWRKVEDFGGAIAKLAGVPLKNVMRDIRTMGNWFGLPWAAGNADRPTNANVVRESVTSQFKNTISAEGLGLVPYETSNTAYYDRYYRALKEENQEKAEYYRDYLTMGLGLSEKAIDSGLKAQVKVRVLSGELGKEEAIAWLVKQGLSDTEKKAFSLVDGWLKKAGHADDEEYSYSAYNGVIEAVLANDAQGVKEAKAEMMAMGYEQKEISSAIRSGIGEKYADGEIDRAKAEKLLNAYGDMDSVKTYGADAEDEDKIYWTLKKYGTGEADFSRYDDLYAAVDQGSAAGVQAATRELTAHGSDEDEVKSRIRSYIGSQFKAGKYTEAQANSLMKTFGGMADKDDLYWQMRQWKAEKANASVKGYEYGKYDDFHQAVETGRNLAAVIREYTEHGIEAQTLAAQITKEYKERFVSLYKTDMTAAANLQARLLTAYEALGYSRAKKQKDIQKWLKDEE